MSSENAEKSFPMNPETGTDVELDEIVSAYIDRLVSGEMLDQEEIEKAHPDIAQDILDRLDVYQAFGCETAPPLGTLGDYTLRRQIGRGGMGVVYEAWQGSMDRVVALKVLPPGVAADSKAWSRFMREAQLMGKLNDIAIFAGVDLLAKHPRRPLNGKYSVLPEQRHELLGKTGARPYSKRQLLMDLCAAAEWFVTELRHRRPDTWQDDIDDAYELLGRYGDEALRDALIVASRQETVGAEYLEAILEGHAKREAVTS